MLFLLISNSLSQSYLWNLSCPAGPEPAQIPNSVSLESSPHDLYAMTLRAGYSVVHLLKSLYLIALASGLLMAGKPTYFFFLKSLFAIFYCFILTFSFFDINFGTKSWWLCLGSIAASQTSKPTYLLKLLFSIFLLFYMAFFFEIWHQKHDHSKKYSKNETWNYELSVEKVIDYKNKSGRFLKLKKFKWNW